MEDKADRDFPYGIKVDEMSSECRKCSSEILVNFEMMTLQSSCWVVFESSLPPHPKIRSTGLTEKYSKLIVMIKKRVWDNFVFMTWYFFSAGSSQQMMVHCVHFETHQTMQRFSKHLFWRGCQACSLIFLSGVTKCALLLLQPACFQGSTCCALRDALLHLL